MTEEIKPEPLMRISSSHWIRNTEIVGVIIDVFGKIENGNKTAESIARDRDTKADYIE